MSRRLIAWAASAVIVVAIGGCSGNQSPGPATTSLTAGTDTSSAQALPRAGAPKVPNPLPASVLSGDVCGALTPQQVKDALGIDVAGKADTTQGLGPTCYWSNVETGSAISVFFLTEPRDGLSGDYANVKPKAVVWKELPAIQGFPAVASLTPSGGDPKMNCAVSIGLADDLSVDVALTIGRAKVGQVDPCSVAPRTADAVVTTLRQKAGS